MRKTPWKLPAGFEMPDGFQEFGHDRRGNLIYQRIAADGRYERILYPGPFRNTPWLIGYGKPSPWDFVCALNLPV